MPSTSPSGFDVRLLSALNLSLPQSSAEFHENSTSSATDQLLANLGQLLATTSKTVSKAANAGSKAGNYTKEGASGTDDYINSDSEDTGIATGSFTSQETDVSEKAEPQPGCVPMPRFLSSTPCKVLTPHEAMASPRGWDFAEQVQQMRPGWPSQPQSEQRLHTYIRRRQPEETGGHKQWRLEEQKQRRLEQQWQRQRRLEQFQTSSGD